MSVLQILKFKHTTTVVASLFLIICSFKVWSHDVSVLQSKPIFKLEIEAYGLAYFVGVNGGNTLSEFDPDNQISVDLPINQWMHPEESEFSFLVIPKPGTDGFSDRSFLHVTLLIEDKNDDEVKFRLPLLIFDGNKFKSHQEMDKSLPKSRYHLVGNEVIEGSGEIELSRIDKSKYKYYEGGFTYTRTAIIPNSLPLWSFFKGDTLPDYDEMSEDELRDAVEDLFPIYKKVQDALIAKDVEALSKMFSERSKEADLAFYQPKGTMDKNVRKLTQKLLDDPGWTLQKRTVQDVGLTSFNNRRLVKLRVGADSGAIGFLKNNGSYYGLEIILRRENGEWIVTR